MTEISALTTGVLQAATAQTRATPDAPAEAVARLEAALDQSQQMPAQPQPAMENATEPMAVGATETPAESMQTVAIAPAADGTAGDAILKSLGRMSQAFDGTVDQITKALSAVKPGEMMNASDLVKLQFQLMQVTLQQDVTGKVSGKATQSLDTFLKNQ